MNGGYQLAGIDVHKKMLAVVIADVAEPGEYRFERRKFGAGDAELRSLAAWFVEKGVKEAVMESTAQYWRPVWHALERVCKLHLAQAQSNRAPKGRKRDFDDAERLVRRQVAGELFLSYVPDEGQRFWRTLTRTKQQLTRDRVRLRNQLEGYLEESRIKLTSHLSDVLGVSGSRMLWAMAEGETEAAQIAALADGRVEATQEQLTDALSGAAALTPMRRHVLKLFLERLELIESQMDALDKDIAEVLRDHQDAVTRLGEAPGLGVESAHQIIAEIGPQAAAFPSAAQLASWVGSSPGREESAEVSKSDRSPKGNRVMRRILNQAANCAIKSKGSVFREFYRRVVSRLGHNKAVWAVAHKLCRIVWKILHDGIRYEERSQSPDAKTIQRRINKLLRQLRRLGYPIQPTPATTTTGDTA
jgi:transposase